MTIPFWQYYTNTDVDNYEDHQGVNAGIWLRTFFRETSLQGIPMIVREPGLLKKIFWIAAVVVCGFGLAWECDVFFENFLSWKANTAVSVETARILPFPAITLCNNNPVTSDWSRAVERSKRATKSKGGTASRTRSTNTNKPRKRENFSSHLRSFLANQGIVSSVPYTQRSYAGHQARRNFHFEIHVGHIHVGRASRAANSWNMSTWHWNEFYGNCFTFNQGLTRAESISTATDTWTIKKGGKTGTGIRTSTQAGDMYGLYLLLNADVEHYMTITKQVGWRIVIHNQTDMPFPQESGIFIQPGTSTRIGVSLKYVERLGVVDNGLFKAPYSDCVNRDDLVIDDSVNAYSNMLEVSYTTSACLKTCYQQNVMKECGCFDFNYPNEGSAFKAYPNMTPCYYTNDAAWLCKLGVASDYEDGIIECDCPNTCKSYNFDTTISNLGWPSVSEVTLQTICTSLATIIKSRTMQNDTTCVGKSYFPKQARVSPIKQPPLATSLEACHHKRLSTERASNDEFARFTIGHRFAEVYIYYQDFNYQTVIEHANMGIADLIAYMGGILGLFFGFTFLTLFEYIQLLIDLLVLACSRLFWPRKRVSPVESAIILTVNPVNQIKPQSDLGNQSTPISFNGYTHPGQFD